jgi:hypothetical protein
MSFYSVEASQHIIRNLSPTVEFSYKVPQIFIQKFAIYMSQGLIKVYDKDGNTINIEVRGE